MSTSLPLAQTLASLPPVWPEDVLPLIQKRMSGSGHKVVVIDDDSTGTQAVSGIPAVTHWDEATLRAEFNRVDPGFFILTNSRRLTSEQTFALHRTLANNLRSAAEGRSFSVISRSDSTLRGHFPVETDALNEVLGPFDLTVLVPFFEGGGHLTLGNRHYVADGDKLVPVAQTSYAADGAFGFSTSDLPGWIAEKTDGWVHAQDVVCISLETVREGGPDAVARELLDVPAGRMCVVNAVASRDIEVLAAASLAVEEQGRRILFRSAASLISARLGQSPSPILGSHQLKCDSRYGGLVVAGTHLSNVSNSPLQLARLRDKFDALALELNTSALFDFKRREPHLADMAAQMNAALSAGRDVLLYTQRIQSQGGIGAGNPPVGGLLSESLIEVVRRLSGPPSFLIAKGGATSSDILTEGLGVSRAMISGQLLPGAPVWRLGPEALFPDLPYVVFPSNIGADEALIAAVGRLKAMQVDQTVPLSS